MSTIFINSFWTAGGWTPAQATTDGGATPHTWHYVGSGGLYQDSAKTTPVASDGDVIGASVNQGSDSHDIIQATAGSKPIYKTNILNGQPVMRLDGTDDYLRSAFGGALSQPFTVYAVGALDVTASAHARITDSDDNTNRMWMGQNASGNWIINAGAGLGSSPSDTSWNIWAALFNSTSSEFWLNGVSEASGNAGTSNPDGLTIGADISGTSNWDGDVAELLIYNANLSTADKNQVGQYLAEKYGLTWSDI